MDGDCHTCRLNWSNDQRVVSFWDRKLLVIRQEDLPTQTKTNKAAGINLYARQPLKSHKVGRV